MTIFNVQSVQRPKSTYLYRYFYIFPKYDISRNSLRISATKTKSKPCVHFYITIIEFCLWVSRASCIVHFELWFKVLFHWAICICHHRAASSSWKTTLTHHTRTHINHKHTSHIRGKTRLDFGASQWRRSWRKTAAFGWRRFALVLIVARSALHWERRTRPNIISSSSSTLASLFDDVNALTSLCIFNGCLLRTARCVKCFVGSTMYYTMCLSEFGSCMVFGWLNGKNME